jgi:phage-related protein
MLSTLKLELRLLTCDPFLVHLALMNFGSLRLNVVFFRTGSGSEPVREWLKSLSAPHKKMIGEDIKTVQYGWPLGMPLVEKIAPGLWETRSRVPDGIARTLFTVDGDLMILLHGFIKKTQKIPLKELNTARTRLRQYQEGAR